MGGPDRKISVHTVKTEADLVVCINSEGEASR